MTNEEKLKAFAQRVILTQTGKHMDVEDIDGEEGQVYVRELIDWVNMFIGELESEADWQYVRENAAQIGEATAASLILPIPAGVRKLVTDGNRPLYIAQGDAIISKWDVVSPNNITDMPEDPYRGRASVVNNSVIFSRKLDENEVGGTIFADVIHDFPKLSMDDVSLLELIKPQRLLILGVAKDATLPDFVRGGISPALAEKYADLLDRVKDENEASALAGDIIRDDYGYIRGVY